MPKVTRASDSIRADNAAQHEAVRDLSPEGHDPRSTERIKVTGRLRRLLVWFGLAQFGANLSLGAAGSVLIPLQLQDFDPANKAGNLALVTVGGAIAAILFPPVVGLLSDRTRGRYGRRAPWVFGGAILGALGLVALAGSNSLLSILVTYVTVSVGFNVYLTTLLAVLPDRVPRGVRGLFSAISGIGLLFGVLGGQGFGAVFASAPTSGYVILAAIAVAVAVGFIVRNPDLPNRDEPRPHIRWRSVLKTFWVSPRSYPDFALGFAGRMLTFISYYLISTYQLYLLQDYLALGEEAVGWISIFAGIALVTTLVSTLIGGPLSDRLGRRKPLVAISGALMAASFVAPWIWPNLTGFFIYSALGGFGFGAYLAVDQALLSEILPSRDANGRELGILNIAIALPTAIAPGLAGLLVTTWGYVSLFPVAMVLALGGALIVLRIRSVR